MFGERKRAYKELHAIILKALTSKELTIYEIAKSTKIHFNVVKNQLILLKGNDYTEVAFEHNKFKLFRITGHGKRYLHTII